MPDASRLVPAAGRCLSSNLPSVRMIQPEQYGYLSSVAVCTALLSRARDAQGYVTGYVQGSASQRSIHPRTQRRIICMTIYSTSTVLRTLSVPGTIISAAELPKSNETEHFDNSTAKFMHVVCRLKRVPNHRRDCHRAVGRGDYPLSQASSTHIKTTLW